jgi:hypothetical protein
MKSHSVFTALRRLMLKVSVTVFLILFYGLFLGAAAGKYIFGLDEDSALFLVGLPTGLIVAGIMWKKLPKILGIEN